MSFLGGMDRKTQDLVQELVHRGIDSKTEADTARSLLRAADSLTEDWLGEEGIEIPSRLETDAEIERVYYEAYDGPNKGLAAAREIWVPDALLSEGVRRTLSDPRWLPQIVVRAAQMERSRDDLEFAFMRSYARASRR